MKTLKANQVKGMLERNEDFLLINVLAPESFEQEHITGSHNVPLDHENFVAEVANLAGGKDRSIVVYCASESCTASPTAAHQLEEAGFRDITDFEGGMAEWKRAGYPVESGVPAGTRS